MIVFCILILVYLLIGWALFYILNLDEPWAVVGKRFIVTWLLAEIFLWVDIIPFKWFVSVADSYPHLPGRLGWKKGE